MDIRIIQSFHKKDQISFLDDAFIPQDNTDNISPELREYRFFLRHYREGMHKEADYTGILSWKFNHKTKITGKVFIDFIKNNPGYDVYFVNPFLQEVYHFKNVWLHGESCHPGIIEFVQKILIRLNYNINLKEIKNTHETALYCNFWVGNAYFWDQYMKFTMPIYDYLLNDLTDEEKMFINQPADRCRDATATYFSFIVERLFSTLLVYNKNIKSLAYKYPCVELQMLRTLQDRLNEVRKSQQL